MLARLLCGMLACGAALDARAERRPGEDRALRVQVESLRERCESFQLDDCVTGSRALLQRRDLRPDQRVELLEQLGASLAIMDDAVAAEDAFMELLALAPDHALDADTPAKIFTSWRAARARVAEARDAQEAAALKALRAQVRLTSGTQLNQAGGRDGHLVAVVHAPARSVSRVTFNHRLEKEGAWMSQRGIPVDDGREWHVLVPAALLSVPQGGRLAWFAEATDAQGRLLATLGSTQEPLFVALSPGTPTGPPSAAAAATVPPSPVRTAGGTAWKSPATQGAGSAWKSPSETRGSTRGAWTTQPPRTAAPANAWGQPPPPTARPVPPQPRSRWYTQTPPPQSPGNPYPR